MAPWSPALSGSVDPASAELGLLGGMDVSPSPRELGVALAGAGALDALSASDGARAVVELDSALSLTAREAAGKPVSFAVSVSASSRLQPLHAQHANVNSGRVLPERIAPP